MATTTLYCTNCGKLLSSGVLFCENCGAPIPHRPEVPAGPGRPNLEVKASVAAPGAADDRGQRSPGWIVWFAGGAIVLALCCLMGGGAALLFPSARQLIGLKGINTPQSTTMAKPTLTEKPPSTVLPTENTAGITPLPSPTLPPKTQSEQVFRDDFSNLSTGWLQLDDNVRMVGYNEGAMYVIALKQSGSDGNVLIPHGFELPLAKVELYFRARVVEGEGYFGAECNVVDENNYIDIRITEGAYSIARNENGTLTSFLDPSFWVYDPAIASENNEFQVLINCGDGKIQLMVNGYSLPAVDNPGMTGGDVHLFASSYKNTVPDGEFYYKVLFDDVELKAR